MPWMLHRNNLDGPEKLKTLLKKPGITMVPGVHNALTGMMAKKVGFNCLYVSGAAFSAAQGLPDLGYFTVDELAMYVRQLYRVTDLPLIVDVDTGFGEVLHLLRTVIELEEAGAAAIQMEDQKLPKKCGHVEGKELITADEMCRKIESFKKNRKSLLMVARTDAHAILGQEEAIKRAKMYVNAGADIIFPEALKTEEEFKEFSKEVKAPLLANMTEFGKTPYFTAKQFEEWGYKIVIYPVTTLRSSMKAAENVLTAIKETGTQKSQLDQMQTREELYELIDYYGYTNYDTEISSMKMNEK